MTYYHIHDEPRHHRRGLSYLIHGLAKYGERALVGSVFGAFGLAFLVVLMFLAVAAVAAVFVVSPTYQESTLSALAQGWDQFRATFGR